MPDDIQFPCPVCGTMLRLPVALAGVCGPCPKCGSGICAPDPVRGIGALEMDPPGDERAMEEEIPRPTEEREEAAASRKSVLIPCLATGVAALAVGFGGGFIVGQRSVEQVKLMPTRPVLVKISARPPPAPLAPEPVVETLQVAVAEPETAPEQPRQETVAAQAEAALRAFLDAPDWAARSAYVLFPESIRPAMEAYSHDAADGPTAFESIAVKQSRIDEETGESLLIFTVTTTDRPDGIPVAVQETPQGWLVDWPAFVEFRDGLFGKFADGPAERTGTFHLFVSQPEPERAAQADNQYFAPLLLQAPAPGPSRLAYVRKDSDAWRAIQPNAGENQVFAPVLEVAKRNATGGKTYLEITGVAATDWLPHDPAN